MLPDFNEGLFKYGALFRIFRFTVTLRLRVPHMTVVSVQLVSLNYAYWLSVGYCLSFSMFCHLLILFILYC